MLFDIVYYHKYFQRLRDYVVNPSNFIGKKIWYDDFIDTKSNFFPREPEQPTRFQLFKQQRNSQPNPMQQQTQASGAVHWGELSRRPGL